MVEIVRYDEIDSTNAEARRRAERQEAGPLWIMARSQREGRGRRDRVWQSPRGNIAATLLTVTALPPAHAAQLSFVAALAVADLASLYVPPDLVRVKWPNDVLVDGRKVSGILVESGRRNDQRLWLAVGIGVNLAHPPTAAERPATSLAEHLTADWLRAPRPDEALIPLIRGFDFWRARWEKYGFDAIRLAWTERAWGLGQSCEARPGTETVYGVAEALENDGALRLRLADGGERRISAGDVFFE